MAKLTLNVDGRVVAQAKRYARARGASVSRLVETYLDMVSGPTAKDAGMPPVLARLRGSMRSGTRADYRRYLDRKFR